MLFCASFSKSLAPDLRVGWTMPGRFLDKVRRLKFNSSIASPKLNQWVIADFLQGGHYDRHLRRMRNLLKNQVGNTAQAIKRHFPEGTRISQPRGGFILWVQLPEGVDGLEVFRAARSRRIFILPGLISSSTRNYNNCIRVSCGVPWSERVEEGIRTLGGIVGEMAGRR